MENLRKDLELVDVSYDNDGKKAVFTFLDMEARAVRIVNFNKQAYNATTGSYNDSDDKAAQVEEWCQTYFGLKFDSLSDAIGTKHDVYVYSDFNSLWESDIVEKFTDDMEGQLYQTEIKKVIVDDYNIRVRYEIEGKTYESKMSYGVYHEAMKAWFVDPLKKSRQMNKFKEKFLVDISEAATLEGHPLMIEVKKAMGKYLYGDMKSFPKPKK